MEILTFAAQHSFVDWVVAVAFEGDMSRSLFAYNDSASYTAIGAYGLMFLHRLYQFGDPISGAFFQTANDTEVVLSRTRDGNDGALPNANATAAMVFARLGHHFFDSELTSVARAALRAYAACNIKNQPHNQSHKRARASNAQTALMSHFI